MRTSKDFLACTTCRNGDRRTAERRTFGTSSPGTAIEAARHRCGAHPQRALAPFRPEEFRPGPQYQSDEALARLAGDIAATVRLCGPAFDYTMTARNAFGSGIDSTRPPLTD